MLKRVLLRRRSDIQKLIEGFDPRSASWVVPDLRSKFEIQETLLEKNGSYLDTSVLRASDLWKILLRKRRPEIREVSRDWIRALVRHELDSKEHQGLNASAEKTILETMDRFAPLLFDALGEEHLASLEEEDPESFAAWKPSIAIARELLQALRKRNLIAPQWISAVLLAEEDLDLKWEHDLWIDLGVQLTGAEALLLQNLSRHIDVHVIEPSPDWAKESDFVLRSYEALRGLAASSEDAPAGGEAASKREFLRFGSQLGEVKETVARVRSWLDAGVRPDEIAIVAPDIEGAWPVLKAYLDEEGVPADKPVSIKLNALPPVTRWLAQLRSRAKDLDRADLEHSFYSPGGEPSRLRFEEFQSLFAHLYSEDDLARHDAVAAAYQRGPKFEKICARDAFLMTAVQLWDSKDLDPLILIAREFHSNVPEAATLRLQDWVGYAESVAASKEIGLESAAEGGVRVTNFWSAHSMRMKKRIFLGLCEELLREPNRNPLPLPLAQKLSEIGFHQEHPDHSLLEFELRWLSEAASEEDLYFVSSSGFEGQPLTASPFWLRSFLEANGAKDIEKIHLPKSPAWDLLRAEPAKIPGVRGWTAARSLVLNHGLDRDAGLTDEELMKSAAPRKLSPSSIEAYARCPFVFASTQLFRLKDLEELDMDLGAAGLGQLNHELLAHLVTEGYLTKPELQNATTEQLKEVVEKVREKVGLQLIDEKSWPALCARQVKTASRFLEIERNWQKAHPLRKFHAPEAAWSMSLDPKTGTFTRGAVEGQIVIGGRIDRLETDGQGRWVVIDYKSSGGSLKNHPRWLEENALQLLFYMWAVEKSALDGVGGEVMGAFYYVLRDMNRDKGLQIDEDGSMLFPPSGRKSSAANRQRKQDLFVELERKILETVANQAEGRYSPKPFRSDLCDTCEWRVLCRAPHLN